MFIREYKTYNKKTNTVYVTHRLVESYRMEKGTRQRIILHLGTLTLPKTQWRDLAIILESRLSGRQIKVEMDSILHKIADKSILHSKLIQKQRTEKEEIEKEERFISIDLNSLQSQEHRSIGPELVVNNVWNRLGFSEILEACNFSKREINIAMAVIAGRLISPSSDIDTWRWIRNRTSLPEFLPVDISKVGKDQVYEIVDLFLVYKKKIEYLLRKKQEKLFPRDKLLYLYDLTNTYFEGNSLSNHLAKRGKCKSKRTDCPLVTLALLVDSEGFPIFSEIYPGNQSEPETFESILNRVEQNLKEQSEDLIKPTMAMDRGIATTENLKLLKMRGYQYVLIERRPVEKSYIKEFEEAKENFNKIEISRNSAYGDESAIYLKRVENDNETCRVLCFSPGKERKEYSINELKEKRFLNELEGLKRSVEKKKYVKKPDKVNERIGRIRQKHSGISKYYNICVQKEEDIITAINWKLKDDKKNSSILDGCYVIETTHKELNEYEIWKLYTTLTKVESAFRALKSELGLRPMYHQNTERTQGHLFISVLAYHLLITITNLLSEKGDTREWTTIKNILSTHQRCTVILRDENQGIHHLRINGMPETSQKEIYEKLEIKNFLKTDHRIAKLSVNS